MISSQPIEAVIFDLDGLLVDSERLYTEASNRFLEPYGKKITWDFKTKVMGQPQREAMKLFISYFGLDTTPEEMQPKIAQIEYELFTQVKPLPGALRLVKYLVDNKIPIALATGSSEDKVKIKTSHLPELIDCFPKDCRVTSNYPLLKPGRGKPHPDVFLLAGETIGRTTPEQRARTLTFEDGVPGVIASRAAGMEVIWVPDRELKAHYDQDPNRQEVNPSQILESLDDFKPSDWGLPEGF